MVIWKCFQISIKYRENKNCSKYEHMLHMMEKKVWRHSKNPRFLHLGSISCPVFSGRCKSHFMGNLRTDSAGDLNLRTKCFFFSSSELNKSNMCGSIVLCCTCAYVDSILWRGRGKPYHCVGLCWPLLYYLLPHQHFYWNRQTTSGLFFSTSALPFNALRCVILLDLYRCVTKRGKHSSLWG